MAVTFALAVIVGLVVVVVVIDHYSYFTRASKVEYATPLPTTSATSFITPTIGGLSDVVTARQLFSRLLRRTDIDIVGIFRHISEIY